MLADIYWKRFLEETHRDPGDRYAGEFGFEEKGNNGAELLALTLAGRKTAMVSAYATYGIDGTPVPVTGELYVVEDAEEKPRCVIETTAVTVLPLSRITWDMAQKEGEDASFADWQERKREYLEDEAAVVGFEYNDDLMVVYEEFNVVFRF